MYYIAKSRKKNLKFSISILYLMILSFIFTSVMGFPTSAKAQVNNTVINNTKAVSILNTGYNQLPSIGVITVDAKLQEFENIVAQKIVELQQQKIQEAKITAYSDRSLEYYDISVHTDLSNMREVTTDQMNEIIEHWKPNSPFVGYGQAFIDASKESGLDPVYILAHAALESGWGTSSIARNKHNYFGIGAFDRSAYENSLTMGDSVYNGIVEGAKWISRNYYEAGQTSLYTMRYNNGSHEYCTSETWMYDIASIIRTSYSLIS